HAHILQTSTWGKVKERFGWRVYHFIQEGWGAQILVRQLFIGFRFAYIPKGPLGVEESLEQWVWRQGGGSFECSFLSTLREFCRREQIVFVKVEPDVLIDSEDDLRQCPKGLVCSDHAIQPLRTILIDIGVAEDEILARMKQKTRYNLRLAERKGVRVQPSDDLELFYQMMVTTGRRDGFQVHAKEYYETVYSLFRQQGQCELLLAFYQGEPVAGLMVFARGKRAFYFYGASLDRYREAMAPYLLQWKAILWAKEKGCSVYDFWGVPDYEERRLEEEFRHRVGGLWGVYRFKRGFGGRVVRYAGPYDFVTSPLLYGLYRFWMRWKHERL
ncbi:MAG: peptidoglycan bridge formation glycyltransferase FemA/FemB family protein, partial [Anaerolineales bacterium]|nr:peptidoglycan bridge formation glycyltransferase FemA/FemB family protein [Anaerolineales bacterium]MDW8445965.1 peptidoglycan bridge formation glycyltransferase FemA/FemB family protein [Anaerolineales bacterium]